MGMYEYSNHPDYNNSCSWHFDDMSRGKRLGCSIMLHKAVEGGELEIFNGERASINLKVGEIVIFPTFLFHRVKPVIEGKRITLLTWMKGNTINF
jgi:PKHD-type hydroxylase